MLMARISVQVNGFFNLKAAKLPDGSLSGVVRMSGSARKSSRMSGKGGITSVYGGPAKVAGICMAVEVPPSSREVKCGEADLFFYGNEADLDRLYRRSIPADLRRRLAAYVDKPYSPRTSAADVKSHHGLGFMGIPLGDLGLNQGSRELIGGLKQAGLATIPAAFGRLEEVPIRADVNFRKKFGSVFGPFPVALRDSAQAAGSYFTATWETSRTDRNAEKVALATYRVISVPFGGMPPWAREYVRRHRPG